MLKPAPLTVLRSAVAAIAAFTATAFISSVSGRDEPLAQRGWEISGEVQDAEGKPIAGAIVYLTADPTFHKSTDDAGEFTFTKQEVAMLLRKAVEAGPIRIVEVVATAEEYGIDWAAIGQNDGPIRTVGSEHIALRLPRDMPIRGQLVWADGQPVAGASVELGQILVLPDNDLSAWLKGWERSIANHWTQMAARAEKRYTPVWRRLPFPEPWMREPSPLVTQVTTDHEGRFAMGGVGRERAIWLKVKHSEVASNDTILFIVTRDEVELSPVNLRLPSLHTRSFVHVVTPAKFIDGVVRDSRTGKPLSGVLVQANSGAEAITEADGRFRLGGRGSLRIFPAKGQPYLQRAVSTRGEQGEDGQPVEFELIPGVIVQGQVIHGPTGEPIRRAELEYVPSPDNLQVKEIEGFFDLTWGSYSDRFLTDASGRFSVAVPIGSGSIAVKARPGSGVVYERPTAEDFGYTADTDGCFTAADGRRISPAQYFAVAKLAATEGKPITGIVIEVQPPPGDEH